MELRRTTKNRDTKILCVLKILAKRIYIAAFLSVIPGLGQVYFGRLYRGIFAYIMLVSLSWIGAVLLLKSNLRYLNIAILCVPFAFAIAICIDSIYCALHYGTNTKNNRNGNRLKNVVIYFVLCALITQLFDYLVGKHFVRAFFVTSNSMYPSILKYDLILIDKLSEPKRGDVVLLDFYEDEKDSDISNLITDKVLRRIVAVHSDTVEVRGVQLYRDNNAIEEKYANYSQTESHNIYIQKGFHWGPKFVPKDSYFVLSDARQYGFDSRDYGILKKKSIAGIAVKTLWSWNMDNRHIKWERTVINLN